MKSLPLVAFLLSLLPSVVSATVPQDDEPVYDRFECKYNVHARKACDTAGDIEVLKLFCDNIYFTLYPEDLVRRNLRGDVVQDEEDGERELLPDHCDPSCVTIPTDPWCVSIPGCGARRRQLTSTSSSSKKQEEEEQQVRRTVVQRTLPNGRVVTVQNGHGDTYAVARTALTSDIIAALEMAMSLHPSGMCQKCFDKVTQNIGQGKAPVDADEVWIYPAL